jgi:transcriptional regulator with XRE-family HTH domain
MTLTTVRRHHLVEPSAGGMRLKDIAQRLGVSSAYLSQVRHGVRPLSDEIKQKLSNEDDIKWWAILDSNQRPQSYQDCALTN